MPSTNKTPNLGLSQFVNNGPTESDQLTAADYNADMLAIDGAVKRIECGHVDITVASNTTGSKQVVFSPPFEDIPAINLSIEYRWPNDQLAPTVYSPSTSSFYAQVHNKLSSSLTITVHWTAIGI